MSANPEITSRKEAKGYQSLSYPVNEVLDKTCVLRFVEYNRSRPNDSATDKPTATIHLPLPVDIPESAQIRSGVGASFGVAYNEVKDAIETRGGENITDQIKTVAGSFGTDIPKDVAYVLALAPVTSDNIRQKASIEAGVVKNPHTTAHFDGMELRAFSLTWQLSARSQQESDRINQILNTLRERIHPEESLRKFSLEYPDLVYVDFEGSIKDYMPKYYKSFVNSIQITTSTGDSMVFYSSGAPVTVQITMAFTETNIVTRNVLRGE